MLPPEQRLKENRDFRLIYSKGRSFANPFAVMHHLQRRGDSILAAPGRRIGFVVSKKQGKAVVRNRIKRRLREAVRLNLSRLKEGTYDLVFVGRTAAKEAVWQEVEDSVIQLFQKAGLLKTE